MKDLTEILDRWAEPGGHPYKGKLIDWDAYNGDGDAPPANIGCMCAQGQVLHLLGGWSPTQLKDVGQAEADIETAKLLGISIPHAILLRQINDTIPGAPGIVLTNPEAVLGPNAKGVLAIWRHFEAMTADQWGDARAAWDASDASDAWARAMTADQWGDAWAAKTAWAAWTAWDAAFCAVAEMAGVKWMPEHGAGGYVLLPMFGFADPEAVLAAYPDAGPNQQENAG